MYSTPLRCLHPSPPHACSPSSVMLPLILDYIHPSAQDCAPLCGGRRLLSSLSEAPAALLKSPSEVVMIPYRCGQIVWGGTGNTVPCRLAERHEGEGMIECAGGRGETESPLATMSHSHTPQFRTIIPLTVMMQKPSTRSSHAHPNHLPPPPPNLTYTGAPCWKSPPSTPLCPPTGHTRPSP